MSTEQQQDPVATARGFHAILRQVAVCQHRSACLRDCGTMIRERPPSPDYIGPRYAGLVIVGANPGNGSTGSRKANDDHMERLMQRVGEEADVAAFQALMRFLPVSMQGWQQVVTSKHREILGFDIEEIAYINVVKCKTSNASANPADTVGDRVLRRCWQTYTAHQLRLLRPTHVIGLWKGIDVVLAALGYDIHRRTFRLPEGGAEPIGVVYGFHNGQRSLAIEQRLREAKRVVEDFRAGKRVSGERP
ncbi:uracil-DNA glycosylase family protein [Azospirillum soli]|uniref:uracil-DNA glycosylase family protein n=1 Tax=Azospirillum soli TaxID=1304799 RepID=UPI001AE1927D|nr:uracil-DNA glycosylase family protein [Azospirillum soli]MBP2315473.1 hypothetical protein [Azospirillum soli]